MSIIKWLWDFGDGNISTEKEPYHQYKIAGTYTVTLTVWDNNGNSDSTSDQIYVYDWDYTGGLNVSTTTRCLRYSFAPSNGFGWAFFGGDGWPFPEARVGTICILDDNDKERLLVLDNATGRIIEVGIRDVFFDMTGGEYETPVNIDSEIRFKEHVGDAEHYKIKSLEHHIHMRPHDEDNKDSPDYNDEGYLEDFEVEYALRKNGNQSDTLKSEDIPLDGDIVFKHDDEAHRWQSLFRTTTSAWKMVKVRDYFQVIDKSASPGNKWTTEDTYETELNNVSMHLGRNTLNPLLNFATGETFDGEYSALVTGPDGRENSAMSFVSNTLTSSNVTVSGDFGCSFWAKDVGGSCTVLSQAFQIVLDSNSQISFSDNYGNQNTTVLNWGGNGWVLVTICRNKNILQIYENHSLIYSQPLNSIETYIGNVGIANGGIIKLFDVKINSVLFSPGTIAYHYRDVTQKNGKATCPLY